MILEDQSNKMTIEDLRKIRPDHKGYVNRDEGFEGLTEDQLEEIQGAAEDFLNTHREQEILVDKNTRFTLPELVSFICASRYVWKYPFYDKNLTRTLSNHAALQKAEAENGTLHFFNDVAQKRILKFYYQESSAPLRALVEDYNHCVYLIMCLTEEGFEDCL